MAKKKTLDRLLATVILQASVSRQFNLAHRVNEHFIQRKIGTHTYANTSFRRLKTQMTFAFRLVRKQRIYNTRYHVVATRLTLFLVLLRTCV